MGIHSVVAAPLIEGFQFAILLTLAWPLLASIAIRRSADLRLFAAVPSMIATTTASLGIVRVVLAMRLTGHAPRAASAGAAETVIVALVGIITSVIIASLVAALPALTRARATRAADGAFLLSCSTLTFILFLSTLVIIRNSGTYTLPLERYSFAVAAFHMLVLLAFVARSFVAQQKMSDKPRVAFFAHAAVGTAASLILWICLNSLQNYVIT
jgi:hypothetical protein